MITGQLIEASIHHLQEGVSRIARCLPKLSQEEIWHDHNTNLVSVGNLILHLQGNVSQYIIQGLGKQDFQRHRDAEFEAKPNLSSDELLQGIQNVVDRAANVLEELGEDDLKSDVEIQGFKHTGVSALLHVVEHFSYHVGQISFAVKYLRNIDLGYYADVDLNV